MPTPSENPSPADLPQVDLSDLQATLGQEAKRIIPIVLDSFLKESAGYIAALEAAQDLETCTRFVHNLKSSSATLGIMHFSALCKEAEKVARSGDEAGFRKLAAGLIEAYGAVRQAVTAELEAMRSAQ
ncbi:Hpt domain-containing protein [Azonexus sp.]|uniref:Hpt domain-containing protein n=1 Tax=Azonexus sp. TaxID=1872668 RepID=UPI0035B3CB0D